MKGITVKLSRIACSSRKWGALLLAAAPLLVGLPAEASAIKPVHLSETDAIAFKQWSRYLLAGPSVWTKVLHPPVTPTVRTAIWQTVKTDPGGADPMVAYLLWKQSLDPTRFAFYHPKLAPALNKIAKATPTAPQSLIPPTTTTSSGTPSSTTPTTSTGTSTTPSTPSEQGLNPPPIPEPGTLWIVLGMAGWGIWRSRRRINS